MAVLLGVATEAARKAQDLMGTNPEEARALGMEAVLHYEYILRGDRLSKPEILYNLGNAHLRLGDHGRAVLSYRRALALDPWEPDVHHNLALARRMRDHGEATRQGASSRRLESLRERLPHAGLPAFGLALAANLLGVCLLAAALSGKRAWAGAAVVMAILTLVLGIPFFWEGIREARHPSGVVVAGEVIPRVGEGRLFGACGEAALPSGAEFVLLERGNGWIHARIGHGEPCWIPEAAVEIIRP
jgi:tetratricopeptide (TPR) repeat protein